MLSSNIEALIFKPRYLHINLLIVFILTFCFNWNSPKTRKGSESIYFNLRNLMLHYFIDLFYFIRELVFSVNRLGRYIF